MAIGDKAAAKGLAVFAPTQDHAEGYENDNTRGDELADEIDARVAGDATKLDASKLIISATTPAVVNGALWAKPLS
jgi:hypothetical protein